jgi:hypothetical protein
MTALAGCSTNTSPPHSGSGDPATNARASPGAPTASADRFRGSHTAATESPEARHRIVGREGATLTIRILGTHTLELCPPIVSVRASAAIDSPQIRSIRRRALLGGLVHEYSVAA